jgi:hypothetical protein
MLEATQGLHQYQDGVQLIDFSKELPYRYIWERREREERRGEEDVDL